MSDINLGRLDPISKSEAIPVQQPRRESGSKQKRRGTYPSPAEEPKEQEKDEELPPHEHEEESSPHELDHLA